MCSASPAPTALPRARSMAAPALRRMSCSTPPLSLAPPARGRVEQRRQLLGQCTGKLLGIGNRHGTFIIARHIMADTDGDQFDLPATLDHLDHIAEMPLEIVRRIDRN